ncbi:GNAT family N-acetyltransferase [Paenibacillus sp. JTLBN-2024]
MNLDQQTLTIRLSTMKDAQALMDIDALIWTERTAPEPMRWTSREAFLRHSPPASQLVAEADGIVCGYVGFGTPPAFRPIRMFARSTSPCTRRISGKSIGTRLIGAAKAWAAGQGKRKLRLRVLSTNPGAVRFYLKCGFVEEGRLVREYMIGGRETDEIWMAYFLDG